MGKMGGTNFSGHGWFYLPIVLGETDFRGVQIKHDILP